MFSETGKWMGMWCLQGTILRNKRRLPSDKLKRKHIIESIVLVHNYRSHFVGLNQIKTVFDPEYERYINLDGYDHISQYYLRPEDFNSDSERNDDHIY